MSRFGPVHLCIQDALHPWKSGFQECFSFFYADPPVFGVAEGLILVELEETQLGMDLEDRPLPIRLDVLVDFGEPGDKPAANNAQADRLTGGIVTQHRSGRCRNDGTVTRPSKEPSSIAIAVSTSRFGVIEESDRRSERDNLIGRFVVKDVE
jgi:hypothetical protein